MSWQYRCNECGLEWCAGGYPRTRECECGELVKAGEQVARNPRDVKRTEQSAIKRDKIIDLWKLGKTDHEIILALRDWTGQLHTRGHITHVLCAARKANDKRAIYRRKSRRCD